jgi:hypothetical protein
MRNVQMAGSREAQNLVACQVGKGHNVAHHFAHCFQFDNDIYFYSLRSIQPNTELLFWYSREYAQRLQMDQQSAGQPNWPYSMHLMKFILGQLSRQTSLLLEPSMPSATNLLTKNEPLKQQPAAPAMPEEQALDFGQKAKKQGDNNEAGNGGGQLRKASAGCGN